MRKHIAFGLLAMLAYSAQAQSMYKCGNTYQQAPCAGGSLVQVKPASGKATAPAVAASGAKKQTEAERINEQLDKNRKHNRKRDLQDIDIPRQQAKLDGDRAECRRKLKALENDQYAYKQNLYGKTHAAQRASEMAAMSTQCDTLDRQNSDELNKLKKELESLK